MLGLFVLGMAYAWILVAFVAAWLVTRHLKPRWVRIGAIGLAFAAVLPVPLADELVALPKFRATCAKYAKFELEAGASGKTVYLGDELRQSVAAPVSITIRTWLYVEEKSGKVQAQYTDVLSGGGWLARSLQLSPLLLDAYCEPKEPRPSAEQFARYGVKYIEPPSRKR